MMYTKGASSFMSNVNFPFFEVFVKLVPSLTMTPESFFLPLTTDPDTTLASMSRTNVASMSERKSIFFILGLFFRFQGQDTKHDSKGCTDHHCKVGRIPALVSDTSDNDF